MILCLVLVVPLLVGLVLLLPEGEQRGYEDDNEDWSD